ncbi:MAG: aminotransferase class I/II-fold pyridoxal phosphate-dependent enzyme [Fibrobacteres bacterium]|nr:aminotransferase class I/II-fold pyridoxal phosphate-dependent enzyme [Fibrobacterota bacterium]
MLQILASARRDRYPDPEYARIRRRLGDFHGVDPERIVPGSGASELIHRLVGLHPGTVLAPRRTFVEYRRSAMAWNRGSLLTDSNQDFLDGLGRCAIAFLCHPNNPDGSCQDPSFLESASREAARRGVPLVLDLAYRSILKRWEPPLPATATLLFAPNKPLDCAGVRAAYLVAPDSPSAIAWRAHAPSWVVGSEGMALLEAWCDPSVRSWLSRKAPQVARLLGCLRTILTDAGWTVRHTQANFLLAQPPGAEHIEGLKRAGLRLRDASNMGFPGWYRLAARPVRELALLQDALRSQV